MDEDLVMHPLTMRGDFTTPIPKEIEQLLKPNPFDIFAVNKVPPTAHFDRRKIDEDCKLFKDIVFTDPKPVNHYTDQNGTRRRVTIGVWLQGTGVQVDEDWDADIDLSKPPYPGAQLVRLRQIDPEGNYYEELYWRLERHAMPEILDGMEKGYHNISPTSLRGALANGNDLQLCSARELLLGEPTHRLAEPSQTNASLLVLHRSCS